MCIRDRSDLLKIVSGRDAAVDRLDNILLVRGSEELKGTQREIQSLSKLFPKAQVFAAAGQAVRNLSSQVGEYGIVHIATHSGTNGKDQSPFIQLGQERLRLEQIYGLQLKPGSLVVLSSCQSGVGVIGKDVTSLASAFGVAGASGIIASRWAIDDEQTANFFTTFYSTLRSGKSVASALRSAESKMAKSGQHPYYWAGFSLLGDPR